MATLRHFSPLVPVGGYLLVEDAHRDVPGMIPPAEIPGDARGALAAITDWLAAEGDAFVQRRDQERYIVTSNPFGWLQRVR
jgi:cephalosporin hydroxylase